MSGDLSIFDPLIADPRDIRNWQRAVGLSRRRGRFVFVRSGPTAPWFFVRLVQSANCVIWICSDRPGEADEVCFQMDPLTTTFPPFMLDTVGEVRFGVSSRDFRNGTNTAGHI